MVNRNNLKIQNKYPATMKIISLRCNTTIRCGSYQHGSQQVCTRRGQMAHSMESDQNQRILNPIFSSTVVFSERQHPKLQKNKKF